MALLKSFVTLALISGALLVLLPDGSLRRTAALVMGLLLTLCWAEGLMGLLHPQEDGGVPDTALSGTGMTMEQVVDAAVGTLSQPLIPEVTQTP